MQNLWLYEEVEKYVFTKLSVFLCLIEVHVEEDMYQWQF